MEKGKNTGIYVFWGIVFAVIIAVLLIFLLPKTPNEASLNNTISSTDSYEKTITNYPTKTTIQTYVDEILDNEAISQNNKAYLTIYNDILDTYFETNDFVKKSLLFVNNNNEYKKLVSKQKESLSLIEKNSDALRNYAKENLASALNSQEIDNSTLNSIVKTFNEKYASLVVNYAEYYEKTAQIIEKSSVHTFDINPITITANTEAVSALKRLCSNYTNFQTDLSTLQTYITKYNQNNYFENYINGTTTIESVQAEFQQIAEESK